MSEAHEKKSSHAWEGYSNACAFWTISSSIVNSLAELILRHKTSVHWELYTASAVVVCICICPDLKRKIEKIRDDQMRAILILIIHFFEFRER